MSEPTTLIAEPSSTAACPVAPGRPRRLRATAAVIGDPLVRKGALSVFDQAIVSGTSFATTLIIARTCTKGELGIYYLALSLVLVIRGVQEKLVSSPYMIYSHRYQGDSLAQYSGSTLVHQVVLTAIAWMGLLAAGAVGAFGDGALGLGPVLLVLLAALPLVLMRDFLRYFAFARMWLVGATALDAAVAGVQIAGLLLLAYWGWLSAGTVYWAMGLACALACAGWYMAKRPPLVIRPRRVWADWLRNWAFGRWAMATQLIGSLTIHMMPWLLALVHNTAATGLLAACNSLVGPSHMLVAGLSNSLCPQAAHAFARGGLGALKTVLAKTAALFVATVGGFCLLVFVAGEPIAVLILGPEYQGIGLILSVMAVNVLVFALGIVAGMGLWALDRPAANLYADFTMALGTLTAAALLIAPLGVLGAVLAALVGTSASAGVRWITLVHIVRSGPPELDIH
jgi:O-antigen/teichoic acid export membrane protein